MLAELLSTVVFCAPLLYANDTVGITTVIEGDILVDHHVIGQRRARQAEVTRSWGQTPIPISFSSTYPEEQKPSVLAGIKFWEAYTCVRFDMGNTTAKDRLEVVNGGSCQSYVGKYAGRQTVILGPGCNAICTTSHELGHAIGLEHMQTRPDRDQYVYIDQSNLNPGSFQLNFAIEPTGQSMGVPYDYTSVMHYKPEDFAVDPTRPVIIPKDMTYAKCMGNYIPSFYDILRVNRMYKCDEKCADYDTVCVNNGVKDVNNCSQCLCTPGFGGRDCSGNVDGAEVVNATETSQAYSTTLGQPSDPQAPDFQYKHLVITAPEGHVVQMTISYMWAGYIAGCTYGGLEVFTKNDTLMTPPRVCDMTDNVPYISAGPRMYIRFYNRFSQLMANLSYKAVQQQ